MILSFGFDITYDDLNWKQHLSSLWALFQWFSEKNSFNLTRLVTLRVGNKKIFFFIILVKYLGNHDYTCLRWLRGRRRPHLTLALHLFCLNFWWVSSACLMLIWLNCDLYKCYMIREFVEVRAYFTTPVLSLSLTPDYRMLARGIYVTCTCTWTCFKLWALSC